MELSALDTDNRASRPYNTGAAPQLTGQVFGDILLGISKPDTDAFPEEDFAEQDQAGEESAPHDRERAHDAEADVSPDLVSKLAALKNKPTRTEKEKVETPNNAQAAHAAQAPAETTESKIAVQTPTSNTERVVAETLTTPSTSANAGTETAGSAVAGADAARELAANNAGSGRVAEDQVLAKRAGALEANRAHSDGVKNQLAANAKAAGTEQAGHHAAQANDATTAATAKGSDATPQTSDISRLEQAMRQVFQPAGNPTAAAQPAPALPALQPGADALAGRGAEALIDGATSTSATGNRANAAATAKAATARPAFTLPAGKPAEQASVQIQNGVRNGADRIQIKLTPANLGQVEVKLELAPDKTVQAVVYAEKAETLDMLERDARTLQKALEEAGLRTNSDSLSFEQRDPGQSTHAGRDDDANAERGSGAGSAGDDADDQTLMTAEPAPSRRSHDGLLDIEA